MQHLTALALEPAPDREHPAPSIGACQDAVLFQTSAKRLRREGDAVTDLRPQPLHGSIRRVRLEVEVFTLRPSHALALRFPAGPGVPPPSPGARVRLRALPVGPGNVRSP